MLNVNVNLEKYVYMFFVLFVGWLWIYLVSKSGVLV